MATQPLSEIGSIEYFRALKNHNPLKKTTSELNMLNKKEYEIDKLVKKHIKELISSVKSSSCSSFQIEEESDKNKPYTLKDTHMLDSEQISLQNENSENQNFCFKSKLSFNK